MEPPTHQTEPVKVQDLVIEATSDEVPQALQVHNEVRVASLRRSVREKRSVIPPDYIIYLGEHDYDIDTVIDSVTHANLIS